MFEFIIFAITLIGSIVLPLIIFYIQSHKESVKESEQKKLYIYDACSKFQVHVIPHYQQVLKKAKKYDNFEIVRKTVENNQQIIEMEKTNIKKKQGIDDFCNSIMNLFNEMDSFAIMILQYREFEQLAYEIQGKAFCDIINSLNNYYELYVSVDPIGYRSLRELSNLWIERHIQTKIEIKYAQKFKQETAFLIIMFSCLCINLQAQTNKYQKQYNAFKQQAQTRYENFRDKANRQYADFVKEAWKQYKVTPAIPKPKDEEKPPVVIKEEERQKPIEDRPKPIKETITSPKPEPQPVPVAPIKEQPTPVEKYVAFTVYGTEMKVRFEDDLQFMLTDCSEQSVANAWKKLSGSAYNNTIRDCLELRIKMRLSDWAYLNMLQKMAEKCVGGSGNAATLLMAFVYCQSGYQMRLATANGQLKMLYASKHLIFDKPYCQFDGIYFYQFAGTDKDLKISSASYPNEQPLSLYVPQQQSFEVSKSPRRTLSSKRYPDIAATISTNKNLIEFYSNYPTSCVNNNFMTRWAMYANTPMEQTVKDELYPLLRERIEGKSEGEAVERFLNWVQTAFVYEYDDKVWGGDRAFFSEETLYYPYCDCEDRSILFSRLVRDLLGLQVLLVYYPGHLATAVHFTENVKGDYVILDGKKYVICDPTYIGAPVGKTMPDMDNAKATVILLDNL